MKTFRELLESGKVGSIEDVQKQMLSDPDNTARMMLAMDSQHPEIRKALTKDKSPIVREFAKMGSDNEGITLSSKNRDKLHQMALDHGFKPNGRSDPKYTEYLHKKSDRYRAYIAQDDKNIHHLNVRDEWAPSNNDCPDCGVDLNNESHAVDCPATECPECGDINGSHSPDCPER